MDLKTFDSLEVGNRVVMISDTLHPELKGKHGAVSEVRLFFVDVALDNDRTVTVGSSDIRIEESHEQP